MINPKDNLNFVVADGFPFDQETFDRLQTSLRLAELLGQLGSQGHAYIISGCVITAGIMSAGYIYMPGAPDADGIYQGAAILPMQGGPVGFTYINVVTTYETAVYVPGGTQNKYTKKVLQFSNTSNGGVEGVDYLVWDGGGSGQVVTLPTIEGLNNALNTALATLNGNWTTYNIPDDKITVSAGTISSNSSILRYKIQGKTLFYQFWIIFTASTNITAVVVDLSAIFRCNTSCDLLGAGTDGNGNIYPYYIVAGDASLSTAKSLGSGPIAYGGNGVINIQ